MRPLSQFGPFPVAPFRFQPTRQGLRGGFGALGTNYNPPVGAGAGAGAETGAEQGASIGSVAGPIGTAIGAVAGAIGGAIAGSINKKDPEQYNFDQAVALWQQNRNAVLNIGDKYLVLAGLFDLNLKNPSIPIYRKYGHMGEQRFVVDLMNVIYQAAMNGQITASDTASSVMSRIVQPWIDSWGYGPMQDPHADLINLILLGMVAEYISGDQTLWRARSGDYPFGSSPAFPLQKVLGQQQTTSTTAVNPVGSTTATPVPAPPTANVNPVGSATATAVTLTPAQLVASPPAIGAAVSYAPDRSQNGAPLALPSGLVYTGSDPYNGSWILQNQANGQLYVLWQGALQPYTSSLFAPATTSSTPVVTGSGTTGVTSGSGATAATGQTSTATTTAPTTQAGIGWLLGLSIVGTLLLAKGQKPKRRRGAR